MLRRIPPRRDRRLLALLAVLLAVAVATSAAAQLSSRAVADAGPRDWAIAGGMVHVGNGTVLDEATVVIRDGLIVSVEAGSDAPAGMGRLDAAGKHVYPGFITALSDLGLGAPTPQGRPGAGPGGAANRPPPSRGPEDRPDTFSWRLAADDLKTDDDRMAARRRAGFTSAVTAPRGGIVGGRAAFLNLAGDDARDLVLDADVAVMVRLGTRGFRSFPGSMMGVIAYLRQLFMDASHYADVWRMYEEDPAGLARPRYDRALAPLVPAAAGEQAVLLPATLDKEVRRMVGLAEEFGVQPVLYGGHEATESAAFLAEHDVPILVNLNWPKADPDADPDAQVPLRTLRLRDRAPAGPAALAAAGVRFAFYMGEAPRSGGGPPGRRGGPPGGRGGSGDDLAAVRQAVERGLDREAALTALTMAPAEIFGVADRVGTLQSGRIANLVIADQDIFEEGATVETVFVDGVIHRVDADDDEETDGEETPSHEG
ncbi:MAG: amidohydrolase family protein [Acidobacteriota bacterium]|nr:amidohydrolase family protein [Acidobacteriota bacterium]